MPDVRCFVVAARRDYARACVAAQSVRARHPEWSFLHVSLDGRVAPWRDSGRGIFDSSITAYDLRSGPGTAPLCDLLRGTGPVEAGFRHLFAEGACTVIYLNHEHVWFDGDPASACDATDETPVVPGEPARGLDSLACLVLHRKAGAGSDEHGEAFASHCTWVDGEEVGVTARDLRRRPLRFSAEGALHFGEVRVKTLCFGAQRGHLDGAVVDTTWLELERWYLGQVESYAW